MLAAWLLVAINPASERPIFKQGLVPGIYSIHLATRQPVQQLIPIVRRHG
jgi:hypothetical protein